MKKIFIAVLLFYLSSAHGEDWSMVEFSKPEEALSFVENYVREKVSGFNSAGWELTFVVRNDVWEFHYVSTDFSYGGGPIVVLKKGTAEVIDLYREQ